MGADSPTAHSATLPYAEGGAPVGGSIGRYRIDRVLGTGGMGVVVEAFDPELGRRVAIKLLRDKGARIQLGERLRREAQALARVTHPNVVQIYDAGVDESPYLVMQLIEGKTLGMHVADDKRTPREIVALYVQAARGLAAIHAAGLVHRDFKPSNALVDRDGVVHVSDLGLARIGELAQAPAAAGGNPSLTNAIVGTPAYMAPEQAEGAELTAACDQFSFCVALWEALFAKRPFAGSSIDEIAANFKAGPSVPPSGVVSGSVVRALRRGLEIDPEARFPSMTALIEALSPPSRMPWVSIGLGGAAVAGVVALLATRGGAGDANRPLPADAPPRSLVPDPKTAERLTTTEVCEEFPAFGPDGTIYYDAPIGRDTRLFALDPKTRETRMISHVRGWDLAPQPSPDGTRIAFLRKTDQLMAAYVGPIAKPDEAKRIAGGGFRPAWSPDGKYVWAGASKLFARYDAATGVKDRELELPAGAFPMFGIELPDGRFVLLTRTGVATADGLALYPAGATRSKWLIEASDDHAMEEVLALAPDGDAVLVSRLAPTNTPELLRVPLDGGKPRPLEGSSNISARKRLAIRGNQVVWSDCGERIGLAAMSVTASGKTKLDDLARNPWVDGLPVNIPGTRELALVSYRTSSGEVWRIDRDGAKPPAKIPFGKVEPDRLVVSHDGKTLLAVSSAGVFVGPLDGSREPAKLLPADTEESNATFSRDNRRIYIERADGKLRRIASIALRGGEQSWLLPAPSYAPAQSPVADTLAYLAADPAAPTTTVVPMLLDLATGRSRRLAPDYPAYPFRDLRWSPDGNKLLAIRRDGDVVEFDAASGAVLRKLDVGADTLVGATYVGDEIIVGRVTWAGDLWSIQLR